MMRDHPGYHQSITGNEAKRRLAMYGGICYLTRYSDLNRCYVLSVYQKQMPDDIIKHFKIIIEYTGKYRIEGKEETFSDIVPLLEYYEKNRIDPAFKSIGQRYTEDIYKLQEKCRQLEENTKKAEEIKKEEELKKEAERREQREHEIKLEELKVKRLEQETKRAEEERLKEELKIRQQQQKKHCIIL